MSNADKLTPENPIIEIDRGGYACCPSCWNEVYPETIITKCDKCKQLIRWDWLDKFK